MDTRIQENIDPGPLLLWQYEPKIFKISENKRYIPDFYLPELNQWVEVKPKEFQNQELHMRGVELGINFKVLDIDDFNKFFRGVL